MGENILVSKLRYKAKRSSILKKSHDWHTLHLCKGKMGRGIIAIVIFARDTKRHELIIVNDDFLHLGPSSHGIGCNVEFH